MNHKEIEWEVPLALHRKLLGAIRQFAVAHKHTPHLTNIFTEHQNAAGETEITNI
jgi:hypothetical protein